MSDIGQMVSAEVTLPWRNLSISVNPRTLVTSWVIMILIIALLLVIRRHLRRFPGRLVMTFELLYGGFENMAREALGNDARRFTPLVFTLFIYVLLCNWAGILPGISGPTEDLNTCLGLGVMVFVICHAAAIAHKGMKEYLRDYTRPFFFFLPLNVVGEFGKVISHSFRLFGNMYAGAIILALAGPVTIKIFHAVGLPTYSTSPFLLGFYLVLQGFFGLFVGTVQALVFSLLALTYIAVLRG
jgi:F-type H+-transporting ATPase subunit a